jgi:nucleotide-binding universal stress UspA family protein
MPPFRRIFHPTDFSDGDAAAFAHAVKLACLVQGELTMMHVDPAIGREGFEDFPRIRPLLVRWGVLQEGCSKDDVAKLGVQIKRLRAVADNTTAALLQQLTEHPTELLVLSTHQREGLARLTHHSVAEPLARGTHARTLFVPACVAGFVSAETGRTNLTRVLIPIAHTPHPQPAIDLAADLASTLGSEKVLFELVHIGKEADAPKFTHPKRPGWSWNTLVDDNGRPQQPVRPAPWKHHRTSGPWRALPFVRYSSLARSLHSTCASGLSAASLPRTARTTAPSRNTTKFDGTVGTRGPGKMTPARFNGSLADSLMS